jgi:protein phosphatase
MGTTATVAAILGDTLYLAQIGDSRAYLIRQGVAHQLTHDQSRVQALLDAGILTPEEAELSSARHIILQALGPEPKVDVDLTRQQLRRGDVVVLSTDGLHGVVTAAEIAAIAAPHQIGAGTGATPDPAAACRALVELGNNRGGPDNITMVILHIDGDDLPEPRDDDVITREKVP